jgi:hypothetical protein
MNLIIRPRHMNIPLKPEAIEYTALFVDNREDLLRMFPARHSSVFAHHSTIWYRPSSVEGLEIGRKLILKIIGHAADEKGFAVLVENGKSKNKYPYITISCAKDIPPVYSNELLEKAVKDGSIEIFKKPLFINVTEGYSDIHDNVVLSEN